MEQCAMQCRGICCRNIHLDAIIGRGDLVYSLALNPGLAPEIGASLENEPLLYSADCVFLKNGVGPCIFPDDLKPEVCLTTFCGDTTTVNREIRQLKTRFRRLDLFIAISHWRQSVRWIAGWLFPSSHYQK